MDPITAIGAIASCVQLVGSLVKVIKLLQDDAEISKTMAGILKEVEIDMVNTKRILEPDSAGNHRLSAEQRNEIEPVADEVNKAMLELHKTIKDLVQGSGNPAGLGRAKSKGKVFARRILSMVKEKDIISKLERIKRLNSSMMGTMQRLGLQEQVEARLQTSQISSKIEQHELAVAQRADNHDHVLGIMQSSQQSLQMLTSTTSAAVDQTHQALRAVGGTVDNMALSVQRLQTNSAAQNALQIELGNRSEEILRMARRQDKRGDLTVELLGSIIAILSQQSSTDGLGMGMDMPSPPPTYTPRTASFKNGDAALPPTTTQSPTRNQQNFSLEYDGCRRAVKMDVTTTTSTGNSTGKAFANNPNDPPARASSIPRRHYRSSGPGPAGSCRCTTNGRARRPMQPMQVDVYRCGPFGVRIADHVESCPVHGTRRSWSYSVVARLGPFLNKALELALCGSSGQRSGEWCVSPSLACIATVRRRDSPLFQRFDQIYQVVASTTRPGAPTGRGPPSWLRPASIEGPSNPERAKAYLAVLVEDLKTTDPARLRDCDDFGNTMLHEIFHLATLLASETELGDSLPARPVEGLGHLLYDYYACIEQLLRLAQDANIDPFATSFDPRGSRRMPLAVSFVQKGRKSSRSAIQYTLGYYGRKNSLTPLLLRSNVFKSYGGLIDSMTTGSDDFSADLHRIKACLEDLQVCPELIFGYTESELDLAVFERNLPAVRRMIANAGAQYDSTRLWRGHQRSREGLHPIALALDWPEGLTLLRDHLVNFADCHSTNVVVPSIKNAFKIAYQFRNMTAMEIVLGSAIPLGHGKRKTSQTCFDPVSMFICGELQREEEGALFSDVEVFQLVVKEILSRRMKLNQLAIKHLSRHQCEHLQISEQQAPDGNATAIRDAIAALTQLPRELDPCGSDGIYHDITNRTFYWPCDPTPYLSAAYSGGFRSIDVPDRNGLTPLHKIVRQDEFRQHAGVVEADVRPCGNIDACMKAVEWFVDRGAHYPISITNPHFLWSLAKTVDTAADDDLPVLFDHVELFRKVFVPDSEFDSCRCFCSSRGCIPPFKFWNCRRQEPHERTAVWHAACLNRPGKREECIDRWCKPLEDAARERTCEEICRLELFDRLGMAHTCCIMKFWWALPRSEFEQIRSEDAEYAEQLDSMMRWYHAIRLQHLDKPANQFLALWWQYVDHILPPLLPVEACRAHLPGVRTHLDQRKGKRPVKTALHATRAEIAEARQVREADVLKKAGYEAVAFQDVIEAHFSRILSETTRPK